MKTLLNLEHAAKLILAFLATLYIDYAWWLFFVFLLTPDIGMAGYVINAKAGAFLYNLFHHEAIAIIVAVAGIYFMVPELQFAGCILFGHSAMDRMLGYGLKYNDHFKHTHLG